MTSEEPFLPFFVPDIGEAEIAAVVDVLRSGWLTTGAKTKEFERLFAERIGVKHAVAVNSATAALHLALEAIDIRPGDEVIVPTMTFASTAEVVAYLGAKPVLVDCVADTLCVDPAAVVAAITPRTKAIMPVHYAGQACDMEPLLATVRKHGIRVVEDAAHALPAAYRGQTIGTLGDVTCFSFYANKTITTGEGGMLVTADDALADRARIMSLHGISRDAWKRFTAEGSWYYEILRPGFKYNLTDIAAALGVVQLSRCDEFWKQRSALALRYNELLADVPELTRPTTRDDVTHAWHLYVVKLNLDRLRINRNQFIDELKKRRIGHSVHYTPLHMHPYYREAYGYQPGDLPVARAVYERIVSLPLFSKMTHAEQDRVVRAIKDIAAEHRR
ncbi:MAG: DegT/DnrJ/EryC1/StrS family aminotransferase [Pirellulales bacterium]|nr:DegT/DnrJ/EryC1/StrS family aminotransferase [Pirellulales bacterium]